MAGIYPLPVRLTHGRGTSGHMGTEPNDAFRELVDTMKRSAAALRDAQVPFLLGGGLASWARGGPPTDAEMQELLAQTSKEAQTAYVDGLIDDALEDPRFYDVTFELEPKADKVLLTVTHRRLPDRRTMLMVGPGWHMHLDVLAARVSGTETGPFWDGWLRLQKEYAQRLPA